MTSKINMFAHLGKEPIPVITNPALVEAIATVKKAKSEKEALEKAFGIITTKYKGVRFHTLLFWKAIEGDPNKLWQRRGFLHCTQQNFLLRLLLVTSGWFTDDAITYHWTLYWYISPHQYLTIRMNDKTIAADPWNYTFGTPLGAYATGFGHRSVQ